MLGNINVVNSDCFKQEDRAKIFDVVNSLPSKEHTINGLVCERMRRWVVDELSRDRVDATPRDKANAKFALACIFRRQGRYDKAEPLYMDCLDKRRTVLGNRHPSTLTSMNNLAFLFTSQGRYEEAEPLYVDCLDRRQTTLGDRHPDTLISMNNFAGFYAMSRHVCQGATALKMS